MKPCPQCTRQVADGAWLCDCGYEFSSDEIPPHKGLSDTRKRFWTLAVCVALTALIVVGFTATSTFRRLDSPDGQYYALVQYHSWRKHVPDISLSHNITFNPPGFIAIYTSDGIYCGRAPIPRAHFGESLVWRGDTAEIPQVASWDLSLRKVTVHHYVYSE